MITVIINVYNGEKYIRKCLDSIINQTYKDLEILIINDGSTDKTLSICKSYKDKRIRIITTKNQGLSLSRNVGLDNAKGDYIYFVDVDDFIELDTIEYLYKLSKKYKTDITTCNSMDIVNYDFKLKEQEENIEILSSKEMLKKVLLHLNNSTTIWNKLIKKELFNDIRFEDRIVNDITVVYRLIINTDKVTYSNKIKYYYFRNSDSITFTKKNNIDRCIDIYNASLERYKNINKIYPDFEENDMGMMRTIIMLYTRGKEIKFFLKKEKALKIYKGLFSLKVLKHSTGFKEKFKLIIFRINPGFYNFIIETYLKIRGKK